MGEERILTKARSFGFAEVLCLQGRGIESFASTGANDVLLRPQRDVVAIAGAQRGDRACGTRIDGCSCPPPERWTRGRRFQ